MPTIFNGQEFIEIPYDAAEQIGGADWASQHAPSPAEAQFVPSELGAEPGLGVDTSLQAPQFVPPEPQAPAPQAGLLPSLSNSESQSVRYKFNPNAAPPPADYSPVQQMEQQSRDAYNTGQAALEPERAAIEQGYASLAPQRKAIDDQNAIDEFVLQGRLDQSRAESETKIAQARAAVPSKDPGRVFRNMGTWNKIAFALAAGIQGGLNPGGKNHIIDHLEQMVRDDLDAQETDIATAREGVYREERAADRSRFDWKERFDRQHTGYIQRMDAIRNQALDLAQRSQSLVNKQNNLEVARAADERSMARAGQYIESNAQIAHQDWRTQTAEVAATRRVRMQIDATADENKKDRAAKKVDEPKSDLVRIGNSKYTRKPIYLPRDVFETMEKSKIDELVKDFGSNEQTLQSLEEFSRLREEIGRKYAGKGKGVRGIGSEDRKRLEAAHGRISFEEIKKLSGLAYTDKQWEKLREIVPEAPGWIGVENDKVLADFTDSVRNRLDTTAIGRDVRDEDGRPFDVWARTTREREPNIGAEANALGAARDQVITAMTSDTPAQVASAMGAMADYIAGDNTMAGLLGGVIAGAKSSGDGVDVSKVNYSPETRALAIQRIETAMARASAKAAQDGDYPSVRRIKDSGEKLIEMLKFRESVKPESTPLEDLATTKEFSPGL